MNRRHTFLLGSIYVLSLLGYSVTMVQAQDKSIPLQHVVFKDKIVADNLSSFFAVTSAHVVKIFISRQDNYYQCDLSQINFVHSIEVSPPLNWAEWNGRIVVLYAAKSFDPDQVCTITNKTDNSNLLKYVRGILPKIYIDVVSDNPKTKGKQEEVKFGSMESPHWTLRIIRGKKILFNDHNGYRSDDIIDIPVAPESVPNTKPSTQ